MFFMFLIFGLFGVFDFVIVKKMDFRVCDLVFAAATVLFLG